MDTIRSNDGTLIAFERSGNGPALVLVHGTTADHTRWASVLPMLEQYFTVYAVDRRGRGESGDSANYAIEREYEDVAAVVRSISGLVNLLGHSYGALCSLEAALLVTNLNRLVLYEPYFPVTRSIYSTDIRARIQAPLDSGDREAALLMFFREVVGMSEHEIALMRTEPVWKARLTAAHTIPREFADEDYVFDPLRFKNLEVPTLLLSGNESPDTLKAPTEAIHAALPESRIAVMPGQQHIAMRTAPEMFVRLVTDFLLESGRYNKK
ncbi:MAG: alpha/beta hydrolase [Methanoculleus sp.]